MDDDIYLNIPNLYELAQNNKDPNLLLGDLQHNAVPSRDPNNKWFTPFYTFKEETYPDYLSGTGYLMTRAVAQQLYSSALETKFFHHEDVYVTGILAR